MAAEVRRNAHKHIDMQQINKIDPVDQPILRSFRRTTERECTRFPSQRGGKPWLGDTEGVYSGVLRFVHASC